MPTFMQLPAELGGKRYGPFAGPVQVGSNRLKCQVGIDGLASVHAVITETGQGRWTVQQTERNAALFLLRQGQTYPVNGSIAAAVGDALAFGAPNGPRLILQWQSPAPMPAGMPPAMTQGGMPGMPGQRGRRGSYGQQWSNELQRSARTSLLTAHPSFQHASRAMYQVRSGSFFRPRNLIAAGGALALLIGATVVPCCGAIGAIVGLDLPIGQ